METDSDWQKFHLAADTCCKNGDYIRAKEFATQLYDSIALYYEEEMDDEKVCVAYDRCLGLALELNDSSLALKCLYREKFHSLEYIDPAMFWGGILTNPESHLAMKLKIIRDVRSVIDEYEHRSGPVVSNCIKEIQICYHLLLSTYCIDRSSMELILREVLKFDISNGWKLLKKQNPRPVCGMCKNLCKSHSSDPNLALVMELWACALEQLEMLDVAINKAKDAIAMAEAIHDKTSFERLLTRLETKVAELNESTCAERPEIAAAKVSKRSNTDVKRELLKRENKRERVKKKNKDKETVLGRLTTTESDGTEPNCCSKYDSDASQDAQEITLTLSDNSPKSWKDVKDFDLPVTKPKRKRRRNRTGDSGLSSTGHQTGTPEFGSEVNSEGSCIFSNMHVADSEDSEDEYQPLPASSTHDLYFTDQTQDFNSQFFNQESEEDDLQEDTFFNESCERLLQPEDINLDIMHDIDKRVLENGLNLSERFIGSFKRNKMKYAEYPDLKTKEESLMLCLKKPQKYKHCRITIETSHGAVCTVLDEKDKIKTIEISGRSKCGKVYNEDEVVVEILSEPLGGDVIPRLNKTPSFGYKSEGKVYGQVVGITKRTRFNNIKNPVLLCTLDAFETHLVKPLCKTVPKISILHNNIENQFQIETYRFDENAKDLKFEELKSIDPANRNGYLFLVCLICWNELYPVGAVLSVHSFSENSKSNLKVLCLQNQIPTYYKEETIQLTNDIIQNPFQENMHKPREVLAEDHQAFTIDPPGSKDLDDALSVKKIEDNCYQIGVHIADVASVIQKGDSIDREARERTRTFYPGEGYRPHHMLPEPLSTNICSLLPNENRNAISVFFVVNSSGDVTSAPLVERTIVKSCRQFTYQEVQRIISDQNESNKTELNENIRILSAIAEKRRKKRLGNKRFAFQFEGDYMKSSDSYYSAIDAHNLVEEFMLLANHQIASYLLSKYPKCLPLRVQEQPSAEKVMEWMESNPVIGKFVLGIQHLPLPNNTRIDVGTVSPMRWNKIFPIQISVWKRMTLNVMEGNFEEVLRLIGCDELHPKQALAFEEWIAFQESAKYRCSGNLTSRNDGCHFSLGIFPYVHFTSPIRRYADIIVQRLVHAALDGQKSPYTKEEVERLCDEINDVTKREKSFEKQCFALHLGKKLSKRSQMSYSMVQNVSEKEVSLHFPGMRKLPKDCKDIPYSLMKVCAKPLVKSDEESKPLALLSWQQRLYSFTGYAPKMRFQKKGLTVRIDPHQRVTYQQFPKWQKILKVILSGKTSHLKEAFFGTDHPDVNMSQSVPACFNAESDVSSEVRDGNIIQQCCEFSMSLNHGQILAVQLTAEPKKGVMVPTVQMVELTNNVKLCLQHIEDPVKYFARYSTQRIPQQIKSPVEYVKIWLSIFRMESAVKMTQGTPVVINDLPVEFSGRSDCSDCNFTLRNSFCIKRDLEFGCISEKTIIFGEEDNEDEKESKYLLSSDCVCIRCDLVKGVPSRPTIETNPDDRQIWIGHGEINILQKSKKDSRMKVHIRLHKDSLKPTAEMCSNPPPRCGVELLLKADADKRVEAILSCLGKSTDLAKAIALTKRIPKLEKDHLELSNKIEADVTICGLTPNNTQQLKAIQRALSSRFSLIQGPPGTGKTYTGIKLVYLFVKINDILQQEGGGHKQVVFCGPSNKSVDLVARWMLKKLGEYTPKIVRMYGSSLENIVFPMPGRDYTSKTSCKDNRPDPQLEDISLHHLIRMQGKPHAEELRNYDNMFKNNPSFSDQGEIQNYRKLLNKACQEELKHYDVIFCTTAVATNARFSKATQGNVYQMIIDEAGMCTEPETLAPIITNKAEQVVLIGDHKQLQPVVLCSEAASLGLEKSLFERYADRAVFLNCQYRMHPRICDFPSDKFYKGNLETMPSTAWKVEKPLSLWRVPNVPHMFCHVEGEEESLSVTTEEGNQQSKSNKAEVKEVVRIFSELVQREKVNQFQINIVSQYNAQCFAIKEALKKEKFINFNVNTVVASQGGEWDYVIFSTVRSLPDYRIEPNPTLGWCKQNLGFITDQHQINVALTRARKGLFIIGNKNLMKCDNVWRDLLTHYSRQGCVVDAESVKSKRQKKSRKVREATQEEFNA
ncbi:helicase with zinc finger domain 2-like [Saccostrea echinata]|uniref:helicase with zinc finger domain 2-like n=1 Tax=Saccostrea echinata TaxID=191078 RepID=UPI002A8218B1|nr:helicase with zinc finger domain 2-like [Saccostrea echinata]